jgi:hypothetical protein
MSGLVLDAGALIAIDRDDREMLRRVRAAHRTGEPVRTNAMAVAQVWRDGRGRQASLARALRDIDVRPILASDGRKAGELLAAAGSTDAIDATVALLAGPGDRVYTSDPDDLRKLCGRRGTTPA